MQYILSIIYFRNYRIVSRLLFFCLITMYIRIFSNWGLSRQKGVRGVELIFFFKLHIHVFRLTFLKNATNMFKLWFLFLFCQEKINSETCHMMIRINYSYLLRLTVNMKIIICHTQGQTRAGRMSEGPTPMGFYKNRVTPSSFAAIKEINLDLEMCITPLPHTHTHTTTTTNTTPIL